MTTAFDQIEGRLRNFIEQSIQLLPESNRLHAQLFQLTRALQRLIKQHIENQGAVPAAITLSFNPNNLPTWRAHPEIIEYLKTAIKGLAADHGIPAPVAPDIHLEADPALPLDGFSIRHGARSSSIDQTQAVQSAEMPHAGQHAQTTKYFLINDENQAFPLQGVSINIGRAPHNQLVIDDPRVSRLHAQLRIIDGAYNIFDLNSRGGTYVNGEWVEQAHLRPGDNISLAGYSIQFQDAPTQKTSHASKTTPTPRP